MKNFKMLSVFLLFFSGLAFTGDRMHENQRKLHDLKEYVDQHIERSYILPALSERLLYLRHVDVADISEGTSEFDSELKKTKVRTQEWIDKFTQAKLKWMDIAKNREEYVNAACSNINSLQKTWLQLGQYFAEGKSPCAEDDRSTPYRRCAALLSYSKHAKTQCAELEQQLEVCEKIKSGLNELITNDSADKAAEQVKATLPDVKS